MCLPGFLVLSLTDAVAAIVFVWLTHEVITQEVWSGEIGEVGIYWLQWVYMEHQNWQNYVKGLEFTTSLKL